MINLTTATPEAPVVSRDARPVTLEARLQVALEHARRLTAMYEPGAVEVAIAWDTVEELWTAQRRQRTQTPLSATALSIPMPLSAEFTKTRPVLSGSVYGLRTVARERPKTASIGGFYRG